MKSSILHFAKWICHCLTRPEFADEASPVFAESLYMHLTGEVYAVSGEGVTSAFDARRTALPGATFVNGAPQYHPGTDARPGRDACTGPDAGAHPGADPGADP